MRLGSFGSFLNGHGFGAIPVCIDDLANRIDHELGLLVVDVVAAVGLRDVLRARHELREILLRRLLRGVEDVPKVRRSVRWQRARRDEGRNLRAPGPVGGQHYEGQWAQRSGGADLFEAALRILPFYVFVLGKFFLCWFIQRLPQRPLFRRHPCLQFLREGIDEDKTGHVLGVGHRVEPDDQAAVGVPDKHVGTRFLGGAQQGMQVRDRVPCRGRLRHRIAAARTLTADDRSRTIIGTNPGEIGDLGKHRRRTFTSAGHTPYIGGVTETGCQHDGGRAGTTALHVHLAAPADVDQAGKITFARLNRGGLRRLARLGRRRGFGTAVAASSCEDDDREGDNGDPYQAR